MIKTRFLRCECCGFLCCHSERDNPADLICGQCSIPSRNPCDYANRQGVMEVITREEFIREIAE